MLEFQCIKQFKGHQIGSRVCFKITLYLASISFMLLLSLNRMNVMEINTIRMSDRKNYEYKSHKTLVDLHHNVGFTTEIQIFL